MLHLRLKGRAHVGLAVQPPDLPHLCAPAEGAVQDQGVRALSGMSDLLWLISIGALCVDAG